MGTLGSRLRASREKQGARQYQWARLAGMSPAVYSRWESDERAPSVADLAKLCKATGLCLSCIIHGPGHPRYRHMRVET